MAEAIILDRVSKEFTLRHARSIKEMTVRKLRRQESSSKFVAVKETSLVIAEGERVGLMGLNGSGKSTLLKLISGVLRPDTGSVRVRGRIAGLIEVGAGMHPSLTGRENVFLNAAILGVSENETKARFDSIVDFSGVEQFLDTEMRFYSSGMFMRLAFAVAVHTEPDVFLVDEVLAVGDEPFRRKCRTRLNKMGDEGHTMVIVSHEREMISELCARGIVVEKGELTFDGPMQGALAHLDERNASTV